MIQGDVSLVPLTGQEKRPPVSLTGQEKRPPVSQGFVLI
jgi:hypothetical protein